MIKSLHKDILLFSNIYRQAFSIIVSTGRVVRCLRAELSATGRAVHGPSCPRAELSGYRCQNLDPQLRDLQKGRRVHRFILCQNYMMFLLVLKPDPLF